MSNSQDVEPSDVPFAKLLLQNLRKNVSQYGSRPWVIDAVTGTTVRFDEVDELSRRAASALHKLGFRRGHVLYYVTYEMAHLYVAMLAAWRLGGSICGNNQRLDTDTYVSHMKESHVELALVDAETVSALREAVSLLDWSVCLVNLGSQSIEGVATFSDLLLDDGKDCPDEVDTDVQEDVVWIVNTSGSTGVPKTVLHTSTSVNFNLAVMGKKPLSNNEDSCIAYASNYAVSNIVIVTGCLYRGVTCIVLGIFSDISTFFDCLIKYKPSGALIYPSAAAWIIQNQQQKCENLNFLKCIGLFGTSFDKTSANLFMEQLPHVTVNMFYASSECLILTATDIPAGSFTTFEVEGNILLAVGKAVNNVQIRVVDVETGKPLGPGQRGEIVVKTPGMMRGYIRQDAPLVPPKVDEEGWYHMEDLGLIDEDGNVYIIERLNFLFKYLTWDFISPNEIENVLREHEAVETAGVAPVPDPDKINLARAYVVLRPGNHVTADEIVAHVANRLPIHKHLHGGVRFVTSLPLNSGGKIHRPKLQNLATITEA